MEERWEPIIITKGGVVYDYTNLYEVSNMGRVRSLDYLGLGRTELLKPQKVGGGYLSVRLYKDGKSQRFLVHRLVATAFIPNPEDKPYVNHIDEIPGHDWVENLCWCTCKENLNYGTCQQRKSETMKGKQHSEETKRKISENSKKGAKHHNARKVRCIETGEVFDTIKEAKQWLGKGDIRACCKGKHKTAGGYSWEYVEEEVF